MNYRIGNFDIANRIFEILNQIDDNPAQFAKEIHTLENEFNEAVYSELLFMLTHLTFEPSEAKAQWLEIIKMQEHLESRLGESVDVRVALLNYFMSVNRKIKNPKIIELKSFQKTQASLYRDELTGLYNLRYFREYIEREFRRSDRNNSILSLVMIDVDNFKHYNDQWGHIEGNNILVALAKIMSESIRDTDTAIRFGGEEFILILPATSKVDSIIVAERLRERVEMLGVAKNDTELFNHLSVSLGIATYPGDALNPKELVQNADSAMYMAKSRGKNQVCLFNDDRRSYRRVQASLSGKYGNVATGFNTISTIDISEGGFMLAVNQKLEVGSLLEIKVRLPKTEKDLSCTGRVVRIEEVADKQYKAGIRLIDIHPQDRFQLMRFLRAAQ